MPHKLIGKRNNIARASVIVQQLILFRIVPRQKLLKIAGTRPAELIDVLVVIPHSNHAQIVIALNQGTDKSVLVLIHVLCLVNHKHRLCNPPDFHVAVCNHPRRILYNRLGILKIPHSPDEVKTIRMKCFDFYKARRISD